MELTKQTRDLLIKYIFQEYDMPIEEYIQIISQPLTTSQKKVLEKWFERVFQGVLTSNSNTEIEHLDLTELIILQRWSIDVGDHQKSLDAFEKIAGFFKDLDKNIQQWILFFAGKAHQHLGNLDRAKYFYQNIPDSTDDKILQTYLKIEKIYLAYNSGNFDEAYLLCNDLHTQQIITTNQWLQIKVLCNYAMFLWAFGQISQATEILESIVQSKNVPKPYWDRSRLFLFQIYVEIHEWRKAEQLLSLLIRDFYENKSDYTSSFMQSWIMYLQNTQQLNSAEQLSNEFEKEYLDSIGLYHKIGYYADCKKLEITNIIKLSQEARQKNDTYSRYYLWLRQLKKGHLEINPNRSLKILNTLIKYFKKKYLLFDLNLAETLKIISKQSEINNEWLSNILELGQGYLLNFIAKADFEKNIIFVNLKLNKIYFSKGKIIDLGKDINSGLILRSLSEKIFDTELAVRKIFDDPNPDEYSFKKLQLAIHRLNKRLNFSLVNINKKTLTIDPNFDIFIINTD